MSRGWFDFRPHAHVPPGFIGQYYRGVKQPLPRLVYVQARKLFASNVKCQIHTPTPEHEKRADHIRYLVMLNVWSSSSYFRLVTSIAVTSLNSAVNMYESQSHVLRGRQNFTPIGQLRLITPITSTAGNYKHLVSQSKVLILLDAGILQSCSREGNEHGVTGNAVAWRVQTFIGDQKKNRVQAHTSTYERDRDRQRVLTSIRSATRSTSEPRALA